MSGRSLARLTELCVHADFVHEHTYIAPFIPPAVLASAVDSYGCDAAAGDVLLLSDGTFYGSAKDGFLLTPTVLCWRNSLDDAHHVPLDAVLRVSPGATPYMHVRVAPAR